MKRALLIAAVLLVAACAAPATQPPASSPKVAQALATPDAMQSPAVSVNALRARASALTAAHRAKRFSAVFESLPPTYRRVVAQQNNFTQSQYRTDFLNRQHTGSTEASISSMTIDVAQDALRKGKRGTTFATLPTRRRVTGQDGNSLTFIGSTIALQENGNWYFLVLDTGAQLKLLQRAYPDLRGVKWPGLKLEKNG